MNIKNRTSHIFIRILKIIGIVVASIFFLFGVLTWIVFEKKNEWLEKQIQSYLKESQSGELKIRSIDFKLFRNFPNVTIELNEVDYYEHQDSLRQQSEKPILHANKLYVAFELMPLLKNEELKISIISLSNARLNIIEYSNGIFNINNALSKPIIANRKVIPKSTSPPSAGKKRDMPKAPVAAKPAMHVDLHEVNLNDILITWKSCTDINPYIGLIKEMKTDISKEGSLLAVKISSTNEVQKIIVKDRQLPQGDLNYYALVSYDIEKKYLTIEETDLKYNAISANIRGTYDNSKNRMLDLYVNASSKNLEFLSYIINSDLVKKNPDLLKQGNVIMQGRVFGELNNQSMQVDVTFDVKNPDFLSFVMREETIKKNKEALRQINSYVNGRIFGELNKQTPQMEISFGLKNLDLELPKNLGTFQNLGFEGKFSSGKSTDHSEASLQIKNITGKLPDGFFNGQLTLRNFTNPIISYKLNTQLKVDGFDQIFSIDFLRELKGTVSAQANYSGPVKLFKEHQMGKNRSSLITLKNLSFIVSKTNQLVSGLSGEIETSNNQTTLRDLSFKYADDDIEVNATIDNLIYLLFFRETNISASGNLKSGQIYTRDFIFDTLGNAQVQDRISNLDFDFDITAATIHDGDNSSETYVDFDVRNLRAHFDKLPDLVSLDTKGRYWKEDSCHSLNLNKFHAIMPHGKIDVIGDMLIPQSKLVQFNARVKMNQFPWTYIRELFAEINSDKEPNAKNLPVNKMEIVTADLDLSSEIITYPFDINDLKVRNSKAQVNFPGSKSVLMHRLDLSFDKLYFNHPDNSGRIENVKSVDGIVQLKGLKIPGLDTFNIDLKVSGGNDRFDILFSRMVQVTKSEKGNLVIDNTKAVPEYQLHQVVREANLEYFIKKVYNRKFMEGRISYVLDLKSSGGDWKEVKENLRGSVEITGDTLRLYGIDIDDVLNKYMQSQKFNLTDLGAVLVAGPLGLAITKGSDFVSLATVNFDSTQQTGIQTLLMNWRLENRQLITRDVAVATKLNRVAFDGRIDFANNSIPELTVAVVDKNGCSLIDQKLFGKFGALQTGKINISKTIFGSVINSVNAVAGKDCKQVYDGKVKNPTE